MNRVYQFAIRLQDLMSGPLMEISRRYSSTVSHFDRLNTRVRSGFSQAAQSVGQLKQKLSFGRQTQSIEELRKKLDALKGRRELMVDTGQIRRANKEVDALERKIRKLEGLGGGGQGEKKDGLFSKMMPYVGAAGLMAGVGGFIQQGMKAEQTKTAYSQFAGAQADALYAQLNKFANETAFGNEEILKAGRIMLAAGYDVKAVVPLMKNIGNVAAGAGKSFEDLVGAVAKIKQKGFVDGGELHMEFGGTPLMEVLQKNLGVDGEQLFKMAEKHQIKYADLEKALIDMSTGDGVFAGYLEKDMATAMGKWNIFTGNLQYKIQTWAEKLNPYLGKLFDFGTAMLEQIDPALAKLQPVFDVIGTGLANLWNAAEPVRVLLGELWDFAGRLLGQFAGLAGGTKGLELVFQVLAAAVSVASHLLQWTGELVMWLIEGPLATLTFIIAGITAAWWAFNAVVALNPFTLWLSVLGAVVVGVKWAWDNVEGFRHTIIRCWETLKAMFMSVGPILKALVMPTPDNIAAAYNAVKESFANGMKAADLAIKTDTANRAAAKVEKTSSLVAKPSAAPAAGAGGGKSDSVGKKAGLDATTGGTKSTTINITLKSLVEHLTIHAGGVREGVRDMEQEVTDALVRTLYSAKAIGD